MTNNDILIRLRYALDIKNVDMVEMFKLGGAHVTKDELMNMLIKVQDDEEAPENFIKVNNKLLEQFLNGFVTYKRGSQKDENGNIKPPIEATGKENANNMLLKKVKIALGLTSDDLVDLLYEGGVTVSKGEMGAILRNPTHKNYKVCGDRFARCFIKGLTYKHR
ncbi:MAG: DUF1456 family protein [Lysinibacillus sp.]